MGSGGMGTGSDTRMYNPQSESSHLYSTEDEEDYKYSPADPEEVEQKRDAKQAHIEAEKTKDLPHIKIEVDHPNKPPDQDMPPEGPPEMPPEEEGPVMDDDNENALGAEVSQLTGMPGSRGAQLDQAVGAKTGTGSAMGGYRPMLATGYPMEAAWSSLMKAPQAPWTQKQFDTPPGGRQPWTANSRRSKIISRILSKYGSGTGLDNAPTAVERQHLGIQTKQPLRSFPAEYAQYRGQQQRRRLLGSLPFSPHGLYGERHFDAGPTGAGRLRMLPGQGAQSHSQLTTPQAPRMAQGVSPSTGMADPSSVFGKAELEEIRGVLLKAGPAMDYLHFSQLRSMLRRMKKLMEDKEHQAKGTSLGLGTKDIGHRDGGTTTPTGGTETLNPEDDTKNWGAPGHLLVARGSGRAA